MKPASLLSTLALVAAAFTVLPSASAELPMPTDIPYCITPDCTSPATCAERTYAINADTANTVTTHADCTVDVETGKGVICVGAWTATSEHDVGPVHWTRHYCNFPGGDPLDGLSTTSAQRPPPCQTMTTSCCGIEPAFAPCCSPLSCPPEPQPHCPGVRVHTSDFLAYMGPHVAVDVFPDCSVQACVDQTGACCVLDGTQSRCSSLGAVTGTTSAAVGLPDLPGPPTVPVCVTEPCDAITCDHATDTVVGIHYEFRSDCTVVVDATALVACPHNWRVEEVVATVGAVTLRTVSCSPIFDCTCDPMRDVE